MPFTRSLADRVNPVIHGRPMTAKTESQRLRELMAPSLTPAERILAEGRAQTDEMGNRSLVIVTDRRILWRHVGAAWDADRFPLHELSFDSVDRVRERVAHGRSHIEMTSKKRRVVFEFNRPDATAAAAIRQRVHELGIPYKADSDVVPRTKS